MILHITTYQAWENAVSAGTYSAPSLRADGFIHCSAIGQVIDTANIFFNGQSGLLLLCIEETKLSPEVKYEAPAGGHKHDPSLGELFPHVYGPINLDAVVRVVDFPSNIDGTFTLPREITVMM